ncbi:ESCRT-1 complex, Vps28 subunit [Suhomyces tanzawaensis NRRL Y-17324]|uniref:Vacuolar protein sorting-associated protein 28 n=1 Tax=Suhomyces tanzawaensis NRRL Y-17324 TaxID=984487 RepID=A0A1E4SS40_9ASCO|nr:ESCRT-1 complex, Vps28 subunit [Suhomyces tanzawaensis NRRL Y-17324]ODV82324.1 ESCRT-1 complex, Vps28 subunit [Suhomyces tanzawaensis NRRL Y-17324]
MSINSPPSYAPTATTSYTPSSGNQLKYHQEVTKSSLLKTELHKSVYSSMSEVYSILPTLEMLENSYLKDYITDKEKYTSTTYRLINQYQIIVKGFVEDEAAMKLLRNVLGPELSDDAGNFPSLLSQKFRLQCPLAIKRLQAGIPATIEHLSTQVESSSHPNKAGNSEAFAGTTSSSAGRMIAEITGNFITCMDALKLNYKTKEQLHPLLSELVINLNDLIESGSHKIIEFQGKSKLVNWLIKLNNLGDDEVLAQQEIDSFLDDLDMAYKGFYTSLE